MILNLIQSYISSKETDLNNYLGSPVKLKQIQTELDLNLIGASESFINYQLYVNSIEPYEYEAQEFSKVNCKMKFTFQIANKDYTIYKKIFDRYVFGIWRILNSDILFPIEDTEISTSLSINGISNVTISDGDNIEDEYYKPSIEFALMVNDEINFSNTILNSETI